MVVALFLNGGERMSSGTYTSMIPECGTLPAERRELVIRLTA